MVYKYAEVSYNIVNCKNGGNIHSYAKLHGVTSHHTSVLSFTSEITSNVTTQKKKFNI